MNFKKLTIILLSIAFAAACRMNGIGEQDALSRSAAVEEVAMRYGDVLDLGTMLRNLERDEVYRAALDARIRELAQQNDFDEEPAEDGAGEGSFTFDGGTKDFLGYDDVNGYYFKSFTLRAIGETCEIWVADDLSFDDERDAQVVTQQQADRLRDEIDGNIYLKDTEFFGTPDAHYGDQSQLEAWGYVEPGYYTPDDGVERLIVLADNIRDESFYDPDYPFFIAGFYSSTYEAYFDRNIINLDTNNWEERLESTFFGTTAHEFQHLIHDDNDPAEETWLNEGMSDFAEYLCGYGHPEGHVNFFLDHPENSLVDWDDHYDAETGPETLADYGQAYLLQLYLYEQFGRDFTQTLATSPVTGFEGVNQALADFGADIDFEEVFRRFSVAVAIDTDSVGDGIYNFETIDLAINFESALEYDKDGVPAWGGDYKTFNIPTNKIHDISYDGIEVFPTPWQIVSDPITGEGQVLWGNEGHEIANGMVMTADLTGVSTATLSFDNYIQIEEQWDFGIVQVSTDGGQTWESLANDNTRDDLVDEGYPAILDNLPGFTGYYDDWTKEVFDLTPYAGQIIMINFMYMTDWGYNDPGWFIDNIEIPEIGYSNSGDSLDEFMSYDAAIGNQVKYGVMLINKRKSHGRGRNRNEYQVYSVESFSLSEKNVEELKGIFSSGELSAIVWYASENGSKGVVPFEYDVVTKREFAQAHHHKNRRK